MPSRHVVLAGRADQYRSRLLAEPREHQVMHARLRPPTIAPSPLLSLPPPAVTVIIMGNRRQGWPECWYFGEVTVLCPLLLLDAKGGLADEGGREGGRMRVRDLPVRIFVVANISNISSL